MNSVVILHPKASYKSAVKLSKAIDADHINPFQTENRDFTKYDLVINYGCNRKFKARSVLNASKAVANCVDKRKTFDLLSAHGIPTVEWVTRKEDIPKTWKTIVARKELNAMGNRGMVFINKEDIKELPEYPLYTRYFPHKKEFRIVVFQDILQIAYEKETVGDQWHLIEKRYPYIISAIHACIKASKVLKMDFVGYDVLVNSKNEFVILEANSGPILTDEMIDAFKYFIEKV